jgi:hypothetical protein
MDAIMITSLPSEITRPAHIFFSRACKNTAQCCATKAFLTVGRGRNERGRPDRAFVLRRYLETVVTKSWADDPWQKGAYTLYLPGQQQWYPEICRAEGRVWFASEHASPWPGWMQGAIVSGIKAAREINM